MWHHAAVRSRIIVIVELQRMGYNKISHATCCFRYLTSWSVHITKNKYYITSKLPAHHQNRPTAINL
jgi:hypothetical protein